MQRMDYPLERFFSDAKKVKMSEHDSLEVRNSLIEKIHSGDWQPPESSNDKTECSSGSLFHTFLLFSKRLGRAGLVVGVMAVSSMGILAHGAEAALPGDILYPIKTNVNEVLYGIVIGNEINGRLKVHYTILHRRFREIEALTREGRLTSEFSQQVQGDLLNKIGDIRKTVESLEREERYADATDAALQLKTFLAEHEVFLEKVSVLSGASTTKDAVSSLITEVSNASYGAGELKSDGDIKAYNAVRQEVETMVLRMLADAEEENRELRQFLRKNGDKLSQKKIVDIQVALLESEQLVKEGIQFLNEEQYHNAFRVFQHASSRVQTERNLARQYYTSVVDEEMLKAIINNKLDEKRSDSIEKEKVSSGI